MGEGGGGTHTRGTGDESIKICRFVLQPKIFVAQNLPKVSCCILCPAPVARRVPILFPEVWIISAAPWDLEAARGFVGRVEECTRIIVLVIAGLLKCLFLTYSKGQDSKTLSPTTSLC